ncbi:SUMF1/EgtB/PvdO family nonheme iron enzyme [Alphaproteobacteria bacterium KMM 3653]|uniref:SUMF1/EgtB/PvdO family nonheme iron enzyme n=1 Tax=Harenicola maris TaxID=2841044 RepID=A0AAP2G4N5_9RHOB|nr:SUMF1/EgtB/PvdO family nonheme iron enzyme [Harenicola maris]
MPNAGLITTAAAAIAATLGAGAYLMGWFSADTQDPAALAEQIKAEAIYVAPATFGAGNYDVDVYTPDGGVETRPVAYTDDTRPAQEVTLAGFYMSPYLASNAEYAAFRAATGRKTLPDDGPVNWDAPDVAAAMPFHEAEAFCAWLGEVTGLPFSLPTEDQWELAARSGGHTVPWATSDGTWKKGETIWAPTTDGFVADRPTRGQVPPNPMGFGDMTGAVGDWVITPDTEARIIKGASYFDATIPTRGVIAPSTREALVAQGELGEAQLEMLGDLEAGFFGSAGVRCVINMAQGPEDSGFGKPAGVATDLPDIHGPYDEQHRLIPR